MEFLKNKPELDRSWTLFLDRDGVLNTEILGSYVTQWSEFEFLEGVHAALQTLSGLFGNIVVVTNQRGVGKGIMTVETLKEIHANMCAEIGEHGGRIDKVYACTATMDEDHNRKPNTGMAQQAREDFPDIDFRRSIMVGNSMSDMEFGRRLNMHTVFLTTKHPPFALPHDMIDEQYASLLEWANTVKSAEMVG